MNENLIKHLQILNNLNEDRHARISKIEQDIYDTSVYMTQLLVNELNEEHKNDNDFKKLSENDLEIGFHSCPNSGFGKCLYNVSNDSCRDDCLYCHQPEERK